MVDPYEPWHPDGADDPEDYPTPLGVAPWVDDPDEAAMYDSPDSKSPAQERAE
jgi:hypothetical protein